MSDLDELGETAELFRAALLERHAQDWSMEVIAEAAHVCARALVSADDNEVLTAAAVFWVLQDGMARGFALERVEVADAGHATLHVWPHFMNSRYRIASRSAAIPRSPTMARRRRPPPAPPDWLAKVVDDTVAALILSPRAWVQAWDPRLLPARVREILVEGETVARESGTFETGGIRVEHDEAGCTSVYVLAGYRFDDPEPDDGA